MSTSSINEKLTIQALKDHDRVQPKFKSSPLPPDSKEGSKDSVGSKRSPSNYDQTSQKSTARPPPRINFFKLVVATRAWQRLAKNSSIRTAPKQIVRYENTYRTEPDHGKYFAHAQIEQILKETLEKRLKTTKYSPDLCRMLTTELTADIKGKVKAIDTPRYKYVCSVYITENKRQGIEIASRCLWNHNTDSFASYTFKNPTLIAMASVYGVYFE